MIDKSKKREILRRAEQLKKNPPKITQEHHDGAKKLLEQNKKFYESKDRTLANERKAFAKDVGDWTHNQIKGVGKLFHGFGEGKKTLCAFPGCGKHEGQMFNMNDGQWYDSEHRWFGNLTQEQQERERSQCLSTKQTR